MRSEEHGANDRIGSLLAEVRGMVSPPAWGRVEELIRALLDLHREGLGRVLARVDESEDASAAIRSRLLKDDLVAALLVLHDLHPDAAAIDRIDAKGASPGRDAVPQAGDGSVRWVGLPAAPAQGRGSP